MRAAANFAFANRQVLTHWTRQVFERSLRMAPRELGLRVVYDVAHNIAKEEEHEVDGARRRLHRPSQGRDAGVPGPAGARAGRHGTLLLSADRDRARDARDVREHVPRRRAAAQPDGGGEGGSRPQRSATSCAGGACWRAPTGRDALAEEMPEAYKDVEDVVDVVHRFGISTRVARLKPLAVIKG